MNHRDNFTSSENRETGAAQPTTTYDSGPEDVLDLRELFGRLLRGLYQIVGLAAIGLAICGLGYLLYSPFQAVTTSTRVTFAFAGFEKNQYPDGSKFQAEDLRAPEVIAEALKRRGFDQSPEFQSSLRSALSIEGIIPPNITKERDRLRASGQNPPPYVPDEYSISLTLSRKFPLNRSQREQLLSEIVNVYRENFRRTYADTPLSFGNAFTVLRDADFPDYEMVFEREMRSITAYLTEMSDKAKLFRSPTTNFTFGELLKQTQLFAQIRLNETLGLIHQNGLSRNRKIALVKMTDSMRILVDEQRRAVDAENVVKELLKQTQDREQQSYVLGVKGQVSQQRPNAPVIDQNVVDSILASDAYNFLVREALKAGLRVKEIQADIAVLKEHIDNMTAFSKEAFADQTSIIAETQKSLSNLETAYQTLIDGIKRTHADYSRQTFGDAIRISAGITSGSTMGPLFAPMVVGAFLGFAAGVGLSLLGIYIGRRA
ncbi:MAG: hypothetical protein QM790_01265 [Nibricoccus sp.]